MASLTVENYLKAIYKLSRGGSAEAASTGQIAAALGVSPGTVTSMLKTLSESGLANYTPYEGARLTDSGKELALRVLRRHRLIELFLVQILGLRWDEVHDDADRLEHAISDRLVDRIDALLGHPEFDPHGDPIPTRTGEMPPAELRSLADCPAGSHFRLARVTDQSASFLQFLSHSGLPLGAAGEVLANTPQAGTVTVEIDGRQTTLGHGAAMHLLVSDLP